MQIIFYAGLTLALADLLYRLFMPYSHFQRRLDLAGRVGLARSKAGMMPVRIAIGVLYLAAAQYCRLRYLWLGLGAFSLLSAVLWVLAALRAPKPFVLEADAEELRRVFRRSKLSTAVISGGLLWLWLYSWRGIAF